MTIPYTDSMLVGIIRLLLWILFLYIIKRMYSKGRSGSQLKSMMHYWAYYGSITVVGMYLLVQFNTYDKLTILIIVLLAMLAKFFRLHDFIYKRTRWERAKRMMLVRVIENVEDDDPILDRTKGSVKKRFLVETEFILMTLVCLTAVVIRYLLIKYDSYQLTASWFNELSIIKEFTSQSWFKDDLALHGQYALMNFYSLMTGISPAIALESFGLVQTFILTFVIYWFLAVTTNSQVVIPLTGSLIFACFFTLAPTDVSQLTHSKPTLMAMCFALPVIVFIRRPWLLYREKPSSYFGKILIIFIAIGLIDLFTSIIMLPAFLIVAGFFVWKGYKSFYKKAILAYLSGTVIVFAIYAFAALANGFDFVSFLEASLISISATTNTSYLAIPFEALLLSIQGISAVIFVLAYIQFRRYREKWAGVLTYIIFINVLLAMSLIGYVYFDSDIFNETLIVLIPCGIGMLFFVIEYYFSKIIFHFHLYNKITIPIIALVIGCLAYFSQQELFKKQQPPQKSKYMIDAYDFISSNYLSGSYAVSDLNVMQPLNVQSHQFIPYEDLNGSYLIRDSVFHQYKDDEDFLRANTAYIIPPSVLVFIHQPNPNAQRSRLHPTEMRASMALEGMDRLKSRGRDIRKIYSAQDFEVFEIINRPNSSRINEML